jgi:probable HAF family extracellular repeat protein
MGQNAIRFCSALSWMVMAAFTLGAAQPAAAQFITIDLHASGFTISEATGVGGGQQIGWGAGPATDGWSHELLWSGTAENAVDLHEFLGPDFIGSPATGIDSEGNIVGYAWGSATKGARHAFLWQPVPGE